MSLPPRKIVIFTFLVSWLPSGEESEIEDLITLFGKVKSYASMIKREMTFIASHTGLDSFRKPFDILGVVSSQFWYSRTQQ